MENTVEITLRNTDEKAIVDKQVHEWLSTEPFLVEMDFFKHLRVHSSGCVVFQRTKREPGASTFTSTTLYLHKIIAEKFLIHTKTEEKKLVGAKNGNKLDCRLENIEYRTRALASRHRRTHGRPGYTGVYQDSRRYRAVISVERRALHLGMFDSADDAAAAYNKAASYYFGAEAKLNVIPKTGKK